MIAIIGAGPVGCYAASLLADKFKVAVFEEHDSIGEPVQCTGIVTQEIFRFISRKSNSVVNKVSDVRIFAPSGKCLKLKLDEPDIILDRKKFDNEFYRRAKKKGVKFYLNHRFIGLQGSKLVVKDLASGRTKKFSFSHLIGADGPLSAVAKSSGLYSGRRFFIGLQAVVKKKNSNTIDFYPLQKGFGWAVPQNKSTLRVGVASMNNPKDHFEKLLKKYSGQIMSKQGGLIPLFDSSRKFCRKNIFLIGDAAGFVKATTGGGLVPGLESAELVAKSIKQNKSYAALVAFHLLPSLWLHNEMRKLLDSFMPEDWNLLIRELNDPTVRKVVQSINRDKLFKLIFCISTKKPRILLQSIRHLDALI